MELTKKTIDFEIKQVGDPEDRTLEFIGSTAHVDRFGDIIEVEGWDLKHYRNNPVFLWAHDYRQPPIGKAVKVAKVDKGLLFHIKFAAFEEYPFADTIYKLYLGGFLRATSVGFQDLEREPITDKEGNRTGWRYTRQELYELSAVPVPANPNALINAVQRGVVSAKEVEAFQASAPEWDERKVIPYKEYPKDPEDAPWDGPKEVKAAEVSDLKKMCAWYDAENPDVKGSYKLPHHRAEGYHTVWRGVAAAMAALLGARGGVNIPEGDRRGVYNHLKKHYAQFDKEPPEFKEYSDYDLRRIELGLEPVGLDLTDAILDLEKRLAKQYLTLATFSQEVLECARRLLEPTLSKTERELTGEESPGKDYYSLALNPGLEPEGGKPAGELDIDEVFNLTKKLHQHIMR